ncbi:N-acetylglucosamine-6-phosphate deacetylase [Cellulomonas soli]|uniref:N-acetylglucosamine-6-phosphate deacetylase n=1 Tax=Cellulomonas soli TaxID=931535 RepID=A0A512PFH3_9CELL|nr:N-acetylglucosamine-6-phosphate deacetylase [Cellulomonas soli]
MRKDGLVTSPSTSPVHAEPAEPVGLALRGRVVLPHEVLDDGVVVVEGAAIAWVGPAGDVPATWSALVPAPDASGSLLLPGLVDVHCHGGGGASFPDALDVAQARIGAREHLAHGTTSLVASLVTAPAEVLLARTAVLAELADAGELAGIHLEGPFLSAQRCGAQNPADMQVGSARLVSQVAQVARGHLATMTLAPEVPGVADGGSAPGSTAPDDAVAALVAGGALPSIGHTDASAEQVDAAVARAVALLAGDPRTRGPRPTATHLFNGMRPWHHRDPGPIASCLAAAARGELVVELVADGTHLADGTVRSVFDLVGADAIALVTDAMAAAGMPEGDYRLGPMAVRVADGVARILIEEPGDEPEVGAIAGGVAHLMDVVRAVVGAGVPLVEAVRAASGTPAQVLGRADLGALEAGRRADVVVTDGELRVLTVLRAGQVLVG